MRKSSLITMVVSLALVGAVGVGSTMAYLTSTSGPRTNAFTVGNVGISLVEANPNDIPANSGDDYYKLWNDDNEVEFIPGTTYIKEPTVSVSTTTKAYVFMKVQMPTALYTALNATGSKVSFDGYDSGKWGVVNSPAVSGTNTTVIYQYNGTGATNGVVSTAIGLDPLFTGIKVDNTAEYSNISSLGSTTTSSNFEVSAFAIQADSISRSAFEGQVNNWAGVPVTPNFEPAA